MSPAFKSSSLTTYAAGHPATCSLASSWSPIVRGEPDAAPFLPCLSPRPELADRSSPAGLAPDISASPAISIEELAEQGSGGNAAGKKARNVLSKGDGEGGAMMGDTWPELSESADSFAKPASLEPSWLFPMDRALPARRLRWFLRRQVLTILTLTLTLIRACLFPLARNLFLKLIRSRGPAVAAVLRPMDHYHRLDNPPRRRPRRLLWERARVLLSPIPVRAAATGSTMGMADCRRNITVRVITVGGSAETDVETTTVVGGSIEEVLVELECPRQCH